MTKKEDGLYFYDFEKKGYVKLEANPRIILLPALKDRKKVIKENARSCAFHQGPHPDLFPPPAPGGWQACVSNTKSLYRQFIS